MEFISAIYHGVNEDDSLSKQLSLENKAFDNNWLAQQVQENTISQTCFDQLQIMKNDLEATYPGLWGINVVAHYMLIAETFLRESHSDEPYGVYFGYEDFDDEQYVLYADSDDDQEYQEERRQIPFYGFDIIIKFPSIIISNSRNLTHEIKDLYCSFNFSQNPLVVGIDVENSTAARDSTFIEKYHTKFKFREWKISRQILGCRGTVTASEFQSNYAHSHLQSRERSAYYFTMFGTFCLGQGEIIQTLSMINAEFSSELFQLLLLQLESYVSWESLEGGPHIKMSGVVTGRPLADYPEISIEAQARYYRRLKELLSQRLSQDIDFTIDVDWKIENNRLQLIDNEKFDQLVKTESSFSSYSDDTAFVFDVEGRIYNRTVLAVPTAMPRVNDIPQHPIIFQGQEVFLNIVPVVQTEVIRETFVIHPSIKKFIKEKFEDHANYSKIRKDTARRATQSNYLPANT